MHADAGLSSGLLFSFLLVLSRVACVFAFVPLPGTKATPDAPKVVFALSVTVALFPFWPVVQSSDIDFGRMLIWVLTESAFGLLIGLVVAFLTESFVVAAQLAGLQAGYSYASTIDPTTQADSGILPVCLQLIAGLFFFSFGLDRWTIRVLAQSLSSFPPGTTVGTQASLDTVLRLGGGMFTTGLKLAFPVIALLMLVDVALALLGRIASQLQLLTLAFPLKMLGALAALAALATILSAAYEKAATRSMEVIGAVVR